MNELTLIYALTAAPIIWWLTQSKGPKFVPVWVSRLGWVSWIVMSFSGFVSILTWLGILR